MVETSEISDERFTSAIPTAATACVRNPTISATRERGCEDIVALLHRTGDDITRKLGWTESFTRGYIPAA